MEEMTLACLHAAIAREDGLMLRRGASLPHNNLTQHPPPPDWGDRREITSPAEGVAEMLGHLELHHKLQLMPKLLWVSGK